MGDSVSIGKEKSLGDQSLAHCETQSVSVSRPPTLESSIPDYLLVRSSPDLKHFKGCVKYNISCEGDATLLVIMTLNHLLFIQPNIHPPQKNKKKSN